MNGKEFFKFKSSERNYKGKVDLIIKKYLNIYMLKKKKYLICFYCFV